MNESYNTYVWVTSHLSKSWIKCHRYRDIWMSHVTYMGVWVMSHTWISLDTYEWVTDSFKYATWHNQMSHSFKYATWLNQMSQISWHVNASCHIYQRALHIWICYVTDMKSYCHTFEWVVSQIWMSHVAHMNELYHAYEWVLSHTCMRHVTHMNESCHTYEWVMSHIWMSRVTHTYISHTTHMNESYHNNERVM